MFKKGEQKNVLQKIDNYINENISLKILRSKLHYGKTNIVL